MNVCHQKIGCVRVCFCMFLLLLSLLRGYILGMTVVLWSEVTDNNVYTLYQIRIPPDLLGVGVLFFFVWVVARWMSLYGVKRNKLIVHKQMEIFSSNRVCQICDSDY